MKITADMLREKHACDDQVKIFKALWPDGIAPTLDACRKAVEATLDARWFTRHFLTPQAQFVHASATVAAWNAYEAAVIKALRPAGQEPHYEAIGKVLGDYDGMPIVAKRFGKGKSHNDAIASAWKALTEARAQALWDVIVGYERISDADGNRRGRRRGGPVRPADTGGLAGR